MKNKPKDLTEAFIVYFDLDWDDIVGAFLVVMSLAALVVLASLFDL